MGKKDNKLWNDKRSRKLRDKKHGHYTVHHYAYNEDYTPHSSRSSLFTTNSVSEYRAKAPLVFSFINNTDETALMFVGLINEIRRGIFKKRFFFDSANVENVTVDVLVYIIAIMRNMKLNQVKQYTFLGNLPKNEDAKAVFEESGFYKYVQSKSKILPSNNEKMQIVTGKKTDSVTASRICQFVIDKLGKDRVYTQFLYKAIIELMSNSVHHAYHDREEIMNPCWYLYAEYSSRKVRFIFVDTGLGIATTVRKNFLEKLKLQANDAELIESAFVGEFRTETKKPNRGLGLPALRQYVLGGKFTAFTVLSGTGAYKFNNFVNEFETNSFTNRIYGTIYVFEIEEKENIA